VRLGLLGPVPFPETTESHRSVTHSDTILEHLFDYGITDALRLAISAAKHRAFGDRLINRGVWPPLSPNLNPYEFHLWVILKNKLR
jgi:hypothetical protein